MTRIYLIAALVIAGTIALFVWRRSGEGHERPSVARAHEREAKAAAETHEAPSGPSRIKRITPEERRRIAGAIAVAQSARAKGWKPEAAKPAADQPENEPANEIDLEHTPMPVKDALEQAIPILAACYKDHPEQTRPAVVMTLVGDLTIGTLITPDQMVDQDGKPLAADLDQCLRKTLESLELPPLDGGDKLQLQYSFRFD